MRLDPFPLTFSLALLLFIDHALALPSPSSPDEQQQQQKQQQKQRSTSSRSLHIPILRRAPPQRNEYELGLWAKQQKEFREAKYGPPSGAPGTTKRSAGHNGLVDQDLDSDYYGSIAVGTPPVAYQVILDTGSADLFLVSSGCVSSSCSGIPAFDSSSSSTFTSTTQPFSITYGSGSASGTLVKDVVQMAGFEVSSQVFAICDQVSDQLLTAPVSGLMGLGWRGLAASTATPFWQSLFEGNVWDEPLMAIYLTRFHNSSSAGQAEPGGVFTMGTTNSSLYTGQIDYQSLKSVDSSSPSYWSLPLTSLSVNSASVSLPSGSSPLAAIDTGTTLIGGPETEVAALYALIPNSAPGTGQYQGYYTYPCSTSVNVALSFGGQTWSIAPSDFQLAQISNSQCLGSIFIFSVGNPNSIFSNGPSWVIGDTFLKNVYSVFRANPASIGFATLASDAQALVTKLGLPTPTIGYVSASVTSTHSGAVLYDAMIPRLVSLLLCVIGSTSLFILL